MDSYTAIEMDLQRRGKTGSVRCSGNWIGFAPIYRWGSAPFDPSLRGSYDAHHWPNEVEDSDAFWRIERLANTNGKVTIRARKGKHGTEFSVNGGEWSYRLKSALDAAGTATGEDVK